MNKRLFAILLASFMTVSLLSGCNGASSEKGVTPDNANNGSTADTVKETAHYSQNITAFNYKGMTLYNNGCEIYDVTSPDKPVFPDFKGDAPDLKKDDTSEKSESSGSSVKGYENMPSILLTMNGNTVIDGNDIYARYRKDEEKIYHFDMSDIKNIKQNILYESESDIIKKAVKNKLGTYDSYSDDDIEEISYALLSSAKEWIDGGDGYIYFWYANPNEFAAKYAPLNYVVGKFSKDGNDFEIMGDDITASSIAYKDGYLYYLDNGYCSNLEKKSMYVDVNNIGVYKVRTDGTGKEKLASPASPTYMAFNQWPSGGSLKIFENYLYYIIQETPDISEGTFLYKLPLSGGTPEKVIDEPVSYYYIDEASGMLYYQDGSMNLYNPNKSNTYYSLPLSGGEKKALFGKRSYSVSRDISVVGDYLYISDYDEFYGWSFLGKNNKYSVNRPAGQRYNLKTGVFEYLECYNEAVFEETQWGETISEIGPLHIAWKEYENEHIKTDDKGVKVYY